MGLVLLFNMLMIRIIEFRRFDEGSEKKKTWFKRKHHNGEN